MSRKTGLLLLLLILCGCDDLKIKSANNADSFRFGGSLEVHLAYKDQAVPDDPSRGSCTWFSDKDGALGSGTAIILSNLSAGRHKITAKCTLDKKSDEVSRKIEVLNDAPVPVIAPLAKKSFGVGTVIPLAATASDREDGIVSSETLVWKVDGKVRATGGAASFDDLVPGKHAITVSAVDRAGATGTAKLDLEITNQAPIVTIDAPASALEVHVYAAVSLHGSAVDPDPLNGPARIPADRLEWVSSKQGSIGQGDALTIKTLLPGEHTIDLRARDEFGAIGKASVKVTVINLPPVVEIKRPGNGDAIEVGQEVRFEADARDPEDGSIPDDHLVWRSQLDGELGHGRKIDTKKLRPGVHEIRCTATDHFGATTTAQVELVVKDDPPAVTILSPDDGATYQASDAIQLVGTATSPAQGTLDGDALQWLAEDGKKLATGRRVKLDAQKLGFGDHQLTLRGRDKWGAEATTSIRVTIVRRPFEVAITSPADGSSYSEGAEVVLACTARDLDRNKLVGGSQLSWSDLYNGSVSTLGTGDHVSTKTLGVGIHQITLTAQDPKDPSVTRVATVRVRIVPATTSGAPSTSATTGGPSSTGGLVGGLPTPGH